MTCTSNFDLNIDFNRKNVKDFMTLSKANEYVLDNKNAFLPSDPGPRGGFCTVEACAPCRIERDVV